MFEDIVYKTIEENMETPMIFTLCDAVREQLATMNDTIIKKMEEIEEKNSIEAGLKSMTFENK